MYDRENLYFIALIPQKEVSDAINTFKNDFALRFGSKAALKIMPHITLKIPFNLNESGHEKLLEWFRKLFISTPAFNIEIKNFGSFPRPENPVVYVHPVMNIHLLSLQRQIIKSFENFQPGLIHKHDLRFNPHITIAYRDLAFENYEKAWKEYGIKEYNAIFEVEAFHLLQHETRQWNIIATYNLN
jgi:2'-5' RNA ligase